MLTFPNGPVLCEGDRGNGPTLSPDSPQRDIPQTKWALSIFPKAHSLLGLQKTESTLCIGIWMKVLLLENGTCLIGLYHNDLSWECKLQTVLHLKIALAPQEFCPPCRLAPSWRFP